RCAERASAENGAAAGRIFQILGRNFQSAHRFSRVPPPSRAMFCRVCLAMHEVLFKAAIAEVQRERLRRVTCLSKSLISPASAAIRRAIGWMVSTAQVAVNSTG